MLGRIFDRIAALPVAAKVALGVAVLIALGLAVVLSPVLVVVAALVLVVAVIACVIQLLRHASPNRWGIVAGASLVLVLLFSGISNALYGGGGQEQTSSPEPREEARSAPDREPTTVAEPRSAPQKEPTTVTEPSTVAEPTTPTENA